MPCKWLGPDPDTACNLPGICEFCSEWVTWWEEFDYVKNCFTEAIFCKDEQYADRWGK